MINLEWWQLLILLIESHLLGFYGYYCLSNHKVEL